MPLAPAHPAVVLPLQRLGLPLSALVMGTLAPDVPVYLPVGVSYQVTHSGLGIAVDVVIGLVLLGLWFALLRDAVVDLTPYLRRHTPAEARLAPRAWLLAPLALLIERVVGYPAWLFNALGHPVTWIGALISWLEPKLNLGESRRLKGLLMLVLVLLSVLAVGLLVVAVTRRIPFGWILEALLASSLLAQKELGRAVKAVADGLNLSLESGRRAVSHIVGRDPNALFVSGGSTLMMPFDAKSRP